MWTFVHYQLNSPTLVIASFSQLSARKDGQIEMYQLLILDAYDEE